MIQRKLPIDVLKIIANSRTLISRSVLRTIDAMLIPIVVKVLASIPSLALGS